MSLNATHWWSHDMSSYNIDNAVETIKVLDYWMRLELRAFVRLHVRLSLSSGGNGQTWRLGLQPELHRADHRVGRLLPNVWNGSVHQGHQQKPSVWDGEAEPLVYDQALRGPARPETARISRTKGSISKQKTPCYFTGFEFSPLNETTFFMCREAASARGWCRAARPCSSPTRTARASRPTNHVTAGPAQTADAAPPTEPRRPWWTFSAPTVKVWEGRSWWSWPVPATVTVPETTLCGRRRAWHTAAWGYSSRGHCALNTEVTPKSRSRFWGRNENLLFVISMYHMMHNDNNNDNCLSCGKM